VKSYADKLPHIEILPRIKGAALSRLQKVLKMIAEEYKERIMKNKIKNTLEQFKIKQLREKKIENIRKSSLYKQTSELIKQLENIVKAINEDLEESKEEFPYDPYHSEFLDAIKADLKKLINLEYQDINLYERLETSIYTYLYLVLKFKQSSSVSEQTKQKSKASKQCRQENGCSFCKKLFDNTKKQIKDLGNKNIKKLTVEKELITLERTAQTETGEEREEAESKVKKLKEEFLSIEEIDRLRKGIKLLREKEDRTVKEQLEKIVELIERTSESNPEFQRSLKYVYSLIVGRIGWTEGWKREIQVSPEDIIASFYVNLELDHLKDFIKELKKKVEKGKELFYKYSKIKREDHRSDFFVLYVKDEEELRQLQKILIDIFKEHNDWFRKETPLLTKPIEKGISFARRDHLFEAQSWLSENVLKELNLEPEQEVSYNDLMARIITKVFLDHSSDTVEDIVNAIQEYLKKLGIDENQPWELDHGYVISNEVKKTLENAGIKIEKSVIAVSEDDLLNKLKDFSDNEKVLVTFVKKKDGETIVQYVYDSVKKLKEKRALLGFAESFKEFDFNLRYSLKQHIWKKRN